VEKVVQKLRYVTFELSYLQELFEGHLLARVFFDNSLDLLAVLFLFLHHLLDRIKVIKCCGRKIYALLGQYLCNLLIVVCLGAFFADHESSPRV
jgi:hypothetical protein